MDLLIIICVSALAASLLTFFSGFGLGTILTPVFSIFFPIEMAIALTAIVHFLNNLFKLGLTYKNINWPIVLRFGLLSFVGSLAGAVVLLFIPQQQILYTYTVGTYTYHIELLKLIVGMVMLFFALYEFVPRLQNAKLGQNLYAGGFISGFFGGLTGNQGALRSAFLMRTNITKEVFIATGIAIACLVDIARLGVYRRRIEMVELEELAHFIIPAVLCAFAGAYFGNKLLKKVSFAAVKNFTFMLITLIALLLIAGVI